MTDLLRDARFALRTLFRAPAFTLAAVLALTVAIGANTAVFSIIHTLLNLAIPVEDPQRVAFVFGENPEQNLQQGGMSVDDYLDAREQLNVFSELTAFRGRQYNVVGAGDPQRVTGQEVTSNFFDMSRVQPAMGRGFVQEDDTRRVTVLSHGFWQQSLAGEDVVGGEVNLDGATYEIVGVAPEGFFFGPQNTALWTPLELTRGASPRDQRALFVAGRLADGVSPRQAETESRAVAARLAQAYPDTNTGWTLSTPTVPENLRQGTSLVTVLFYSAISFVLLIACVNIANLLLARALAREREMALRSSLGASRWRIVTQLLVESLVLALSGGVLGLAVGAAGIRVLRNWLAPDPNIGFLADQMTMNPWIVLHAVGISVLAGIIFGLAPALQLSRSHPAAALKEGGRSGDSRGRRWLRSSLVMGEVALALALLLTAGTLIRAFQSIYDKDPGFDPRHLLTLQIGLPEHQYPEPHQAAAFFDNLLERLREVSGVRDASTTTVLPLVQFPGPGTAHAEIRGRETNEKDRAPNVDDAVISPTYFETLGIELVRGRAFAANDHIDGEPVALVTESFLEQFGVEGSGLDLRVRLHAPGRDDPSWRRIVGIVARHDSHAHSLRQPRPRPMVYVPLAQRPMPAASVVIRTATPPLELADEVRRAVWNLDPKLPIAQMQSLQASMENIDTQNTVFLRILTGLAGTALLLAAIGIYGIITYSVNRRQREIGLRMALGASAVQTVGIVVRQAAVLTIAGLAAGIGIGWLLVRFLASQLQGLAQSGAAGPATFAWVATFFLGVALLASAAPAWKAVRIDPAVTLRDE
ncbi:MAG: ABC transporter permease [Thermoanaerobaculia bacterium]|nr:ABC transporter permease [Thermoanaerobaculia bacterium]